MPAQPHTVAELNRLNSVEIPASRALPRLTTCLVACAGFPTAALEANVVGDTLELLRSLRRLLAADGPLTSEAIKALTWLRPRFAELLDWEVEIVSSEEPPSAARSAACRRACEPYLRGDLEDGLLRNAVSLAFWARRVLETWTQSPQRPADCSEFLVSLASFFRAYPAVAECGAAR